MSGAISVVTAMLQPQSNFLNGIPIMTSRPADTIHLTASGTQCSSQVFDRGGFPADGGLFSSDGVTELDYHFPINMTSALPTSMISPCQEGKSSPDALKGSAGIKLLGASARVRASRQWFLFD